MSLLECFRAPVHTTWNVFTFTQEVVRSTYVGKSIQWISYETWRMKTFLLECFRALFGAHHVERFQKTLVFGWMAVICSFSVIYGIYEWSKGPDEPNYWIALLYSFVNKNFWTFSVAWMIVCCAAGQGGIINHILSWDVFIPLSRLTYGAYLIHPFSVLVVYGNLRTLMSPDHSLIIWLALGHVCTSYGVSFIMNMAVAAPFVQLEKLIFRRGERKSKNPEVPLRPKNCKNLSGTLKFEKIGDIAVLVEGHLGKSIGTNGAKLSSVKSLANA
ncbi:nose resistant to fluoxetine protein 6 [Caerostris extrusa]|uniref:Nose resistant to fluoxetine protein 6 n=1 Tax=Caerostris extrusa TaxID=172846 RepID=A0AAV4NPP5_CAEEX|nr:nose resistant to fluoxetine protein 6 [Caerostris extrusa]